MENKLRKNPRLKGFDYKADGYYFITNNTNHSKPYLEVKVKDIVRIELLDLVNRFLGLSVYYYSIMPTHVHVVLVLNNCNKSVPEIWRVFKSITTVIARKNGFTENHLWQPNYYEHVIRNEKALERIVRYIRNNPFKEELPLNEIYGDRIPKLRIE